MSTKEKSNIQEKYEEVKKEFYNAVSKVLVIKTDKTRKFPDESKIEQYKNDIVQTYNQLALYAAQIYTSIDEKSKKAVNEGFKKFYKPRLIEGLSFIGLDVEIPSGFNIIEMETVTELGAAAAGKNPDLSGGLEDIEHEQTIYDDLHEQTFGNDDPIVEKQKVSSTPGMGQGRGAILKNQNTIHTNPNRNPNDFRSNRGEFENADIFDNMYSLDPNRINAYRTRQQNTVMNSTNSNQISDLDFYNLCARTFTEEYSGDPLALRPFIHKINNAEAMCRTDRHRNTLKNFIMANIKGSAADFLPIDPESIQSIKTILQAKIKPDNSKVVKGRMMALKADHKNLTEYSKKVEQLADSLKRSLVLENIPPENANQMVIDDTIDLCRSNTSSILVKASLSGYHFKNPKEVVAKFIIESRKEHEEKQVLAFKQTGSNFGRGKNQNFQNVRQNGNGRYQNFQQNWGQNRNFNRNYGNQNYQNQFRGNYRGNYRGNFRGRGSNFQGRGSFFGQNRQNRSVYYAENDRALPSGASQAQNVQSYQADRQ